MNIFKYLLPWVALLFFITTGVHANDSDKKKNYDKDGKKYPMRMPGGSKVCVKLICESLTRFKLFF